MTMNLFHILLHFMVPAVLARWFFPDRWKRAWLVMVMTQVVDLDHLLADPIYDPGRCSIGFHPFHSYIAIGVYVLMAAFPPVRIAGIGLMIHMALDGIECWRLALG